MPAKKVTSKTVEPEDITSLSFYKCQDLIREISALAADNEGVLTDEQVETLMAAQAQSVVKLGSMCNFLGLMDAKIDCCKKRKKEINESQKRAEGVIAKMKAWLAIWVSNQGKSYHVGEYEMRSRKSTSVELAPGFEDPFYCSVEMVRTVTPDKNRIKEDLLAGHEIAGARLVEKQNLTIK
jgi:hypothetical protein